MKKYIIIDFEFDGLDIHNAELIEFCCLYIKNDIVVDELVYTVKYNLKFDKISQTKKNGLIFNKINSQKDINKHNLIALSSKKVINLFLAKLKKNFNETKVPIMGWNHASDLSILRKLFDKNKVDFNSVLDYHIIDIGSMFRPFYHKTYEKRFEFHLEDIHIHLIKTFKKKDFHSSKNDCFATLDIYKWIKKQI